MDDTAGLRQKVAGLRGRFEDELAALVQLPTVSMDPARRPQMDACAALAGDYLRALGASVDVIDTGGFPLVVGRVVLAGRPSVAETSAPTEAAIAAVVAARPTARFLIALRRGNVRGAFWPIPARGPGPVARSRKCHPPLDSQNRGWRVGGRHGIEARSGGGSNRGADGAPP